MPNPIYPGYYRDIPANQPVQLPSPKSVQFVLIVNQDPVNTIDLAPTSQFVDSQTYTLGAAETANWPGGQPIWARVTPNQASAPDSVLIWVQPNGAAAPLSSVKTTPGALAIANPNLPFGVATAPYESVIVGEGGTPPYTFAVTGGSLPSGLSLNSDGEITGTPGAAEASSFTVTITDSGGNSASTLCSLMVFPKASGGFYASLTGPGETTSPGELFQLGAFEIDIPAGQLAGFTVIDDGGGGYNFFETGSGGYAWSNNGDGGYSFLDNGAGGYLFKETGTGGFTFDTGSSSLSGFSFQTNSGFAVTGAGGISLTAGPISTLTYSEGSTSPVGTVTPSAVGVEYRDTTHGAIYLALGATSADWVCVGGDGDRTVQGITSISPTNGVTILTDVHGGVNISDVVAWSGPGSGNGIYYEANGADGSQIIQFFLGSAGQYVWDFTVNGATQMPAGFAGFGVTPPATQPATPTTLAEVIAILQGIGACA